METCVKFESKLVPKGFIGITLYPNIYLGRNKEDIIRIWGQEYHDSLINHESIHLEQQRELSVFKTETFVTGINFYILYVLNWLLNILSLVRTFSAYKMICFEIEANEYEKDLVYLKSRKKFNWINFIFKKD